MKILMNDIFTHNAADQLLVNTADILCYLCAYVTFSPDNDKKSLFFYDGLLITIF